MLSNRMARAVLAAVACAATVSSAGLAETAPAYSITKTVALGAPDSWDYLSFDPQSHRVFLAHGDRVTIVDGRNGALIGAIDGFPGGPHGVAIVPGRGRGYSDDGKAGTASSFDLRTLKKVATIETAPGADGIVYDPASKHVFVMNGDGGSLTVIDAAKDAAIATIVIGSKLEFAAADGRGRLYVADADKREIVRIDTRANRIDAHWAIANCEKPHGVAIDRVTRRLFVSCLNNLLVVVNTKSGASVASLPIGARTDAAAFDPKRKRVFSSNGDGTLSVIAERGPDQFEVLPSITTLPGARTMAIDPDTGRIYLVTADYMPPPADPSAGAQRRPTVVPGSVKMLFLDPAP